MRIVHGDKFDYKNVIYNNNRSKITINCKGCGRDFIQLAAHHLYRKHGCPHCSAKHIGLLKRVSFEDFVKRANEAHADEFIYFPESFLGMNRTTKIKHIQCGTIFYQKPYGHFRYK